MLSYHRTFNLLRSVSNSLGYPRHLRLQTMFNKAIEGVNTMTVPPLLYDADERGRVLVWAPYIDNTPLHTNNDVAASLGGVGLSADGGVDVLADQEVVKACINAYMGDDLPLYSHTCPIVPDTHVFDSPQPDHGSTGGPDSYAYMHDQTHSNLIRLQLPSSNTRRSVLQHVTLQQVVDAVTLAHTRTPSLSVDALVAVVVQSLDIPVDPSSTHTKTTHHTLTQTQLEQLCKYQRHQLTLLVSQVRDLVCRADDLTPERPIAHHPRRIRLDLRTPPAHSLTQLLKIWVDKLALNSIFTFYEAFVAQRVNDDIATD